MALRLRAPEFHAPPRSLSIASRERTPFDPFPFNFWARAATRLGFAVPFVAVALVARNADVGFATPNDQVFAQISAIDWHHGNVRWVDHLYPPVGTVVATLAGRVIPLHALGLAIVGALVAGYFLQKLLEAMVQRQLTPVERAVFLGALVLNPLTFYLFTENTRLAAAIALFGIGAIDLLHFLRLNSTRDGFRCGIVLMLAALTDPIGVALVAVAVVCTPFLLPPGSREHGRWRASAIVIAFPSVGAYAMWAFLDWAFRGDLSESFGVASAGAHARLVALGNFLTSTAGVLFLLLLVCAWLLALLSRGPSAIVMVTLAVSVFFAAQIWGFGSTHSEGAPFLIVVTSIVAFLPSARSRSIALAYDAVAVALFPILWLAAANTASIDAWYRAVASSTGLPR